MFVVESISDALEVFLMVFDSPVKDEFIMDGVEDFEFAVGPLGKNVGGVKPYSSGSDLGGVGGVFLGEVGEILAKDFLLATPEFAGVAIGGCQCDGIATGVYETLSRSVPTFDGITTANGVDEFVSLSFA